MFVESLGHDSTRRPDDAARCTEHRNVRVPAVDLLAIDDTAKVVELKHGCRWAETFLHQARHC